MVSVKEIEAFYDSVAPFYMKFGFDNIGHLVGFKDAPVSKVLVALDITDEVVDEAVGMGAELIVSHHPLIWEPLKRVVDDDIKGRKIIKMIQNGISAICLHTNMDSAEAGVNGFLMCAIGITGSEYLAPHGVHPDGNPYGVARYGELSQAVELEEFLLRLKKDLGANGLRYISGGKKVHRVACCGGAGAGDMMKAIEAGCDTYVTADLKYDHFLTAKEMGLNLIDADHYCTENLIVAPLAIWLKQRWPELEIATSKVHKQPIKFI